MPPQFFSFSHSFFFSSQPLCSVPTTTTSQLTATNRPGSQPQDLMASLAQKSGTSRRSASAADKEKEEEASEEEDKDGDDDNDEDMPSFSRKSKKKDKKKGGEADNELSSVLLRTSLVYADLVFQSFSTSFINSVFQSRGVSSSLTGDGTASSLI